MDKMKHVHSSFLYNLLSNHLTLTTSAAKFNGVDIVHPRQQTICIVNLIEINWDSILFNSHTFSDQKTPDNFVCVVRFYIRQGLFMSEILSQNFRLSV